MSKGELILVFVLSCALGLEVRDPPRGCERESRWLMLRFIFLVRLSDTHVSLATEFGTHFLLLSFLLGLSGGLSNSHHKLSNGLIQARAVHSILLKHLVKEIRQSIDLDEPVFIFVNLFVILLRQNELIIDEQLFVAIISFMESTFIQVIPLFETLA